LKPLSGVSHTGERAECPEKNAYPGRLSHPRPHQPGAPVGKAAPHIRPAGGYVSRKCIQGPEHDLYLAGITDDRGDRKRAAPN
jgi:hypothetical protein